MVSSDYPLDISTLEIVLIIFYHTINWYNIKSVLNKAWPLNDVRNELNEIKNSTKLRCPDYMTTAQDGGKVVSLRHRPPLPPGIAPSTHFC